METPRHPDDAGRPNAPAGPEGPPAPAPPPPPPGASVIELFLGQSREIADDSPTVISRLPPRQASSDAVFAGTLRGQKLAHFELIDPVGVGGMAAVLRARDTQLDRFVALKILPPETADPENVRRFHQEARAAARLDHENIARVFFCGEDQKLHFIAFEFVEGQNLRMILEKRGRLPAPEALHYLLQVGTGLAHAASRGVVHRDIKPSNIIISPNGRAKLVDMGLARSLGPQPDKGLTQSGVTLGTFDYISPEQALEPRDADVRSDIYSLGCTFYHLLTGQPPVPDGTAAKKLHHHQHVAPVDPRQLNPAVPDDVAAILARMMAKEPRDRYQRPEHLVQHLILVAQRLGGNEGPDELLFVDAPLPNPPPARPLLVAAVGAGLLVGVVVLLGQTASAPRDPAPWDTAASADARPDKAAGTHERVNGGQEPAAKDRPAAAAAAVPVYNQADGGARELNDFLTKHAGDREVHVVLGHDVYLPVPGSDDPERAPFGLTFKGKKLVVRAKDPARPPTVWLKYDGRRPPASVWAALTASADEVELEGIRFVVDAAMSESSMAAVLLQGGRTHRVTNCEFVQAQPPADPQHSRLSAVVLDGSAEAGPRPSLSLAECRFVAARQFGARGDGEAVAAEAPRLRDVDRGGQDAVTVLGGAGVVATQCVFGPHAALFRVDGRGKRERAEVQLRNCSAFLVSESAVVALQRVAECDLALDCCLISRPVSGAEMAGGPAEGKGAVLVRQTGDPAGDLTFRGRENRYHNLDAYWVHATGMENKVVTGLAGFQARLRDEKLGSDESKAVLPYPWKEADPFKALERGDFFAAFQVDDRLRELRLPRDRLVGAEGFGGNSYLARLSPLPDDKPGPQPARAKEKQVIPGKSVPAEGVYPSLAEALAAARPGDVILVRHDGPLPVGPVRLDRAGLDVTVRPYPDNHPVLVLGETNDADAALFRVTDAKLTLEKLAVHLRPGGADVRTQSVVALHGDGQCVFKGCLITLDADGKDPTLAAVTVAEAARPPRQAARAAFENTFVRGDGALAWARSARPFELEASNALVALSGSLLAVDAGRDALPAGQAAAVKLDRVTGYLGGHFLHVRAGKDARGLLPFNFKSVSGCLFVARPTGNAFVQFDGPETSEEKMKGLLSWSGSHNAYHRFSQMLEQQPPPGTADMALAPYGQDKWRTFTGEDDCNFLSKSPFADPPAEVRLTEAAPGNFKLKSDAGVSLQGYGAEVEPLPRPAADGATRPEPKEENP